MERAEGEEVNCNGKHTRFQIPEGEWKCPKCGTDNDDGEFFIDETGEGVDYDCTDLHVDDFVVCKGCGYEGTGQAVANAIKKKINQVPCPCCKGKAFMSPKKAAEIVNIMIKQDKK